MCVCPGVCTAVRGLNLDFCLLSEKAFLFKWVFQSVVFCGMRQKTATLILAFPRLLFSFIKASKCPEKENYSIRQRSCSPWLWVSYHVVVGCNGFSTGKKNSPSFYKWYASSIWVWTMSSGFLNPPTLCSAWQGGMSAMLSRAGSAFVLNRFFTGVKMWQNREGDRVCWGEWRSMRVPRMGWTFQTLGVDNFKTTLYYI